MITWVLGRKIRDCVSGPQLKQNYTFVTNRLIGSGTAESPISHLVRTATATAAARVQQILNHVIG